MLKATSVAVLRKGADRSGRSMGGELAAPGDHLEGRAAGAALFLAWVTCGMMVALSGVETLRSSFVG